MLLAATHSVMATALDAPELMLSEREAQALTESSANVLKYYGPVAFGGVRGAWFSLATTVGMIYVPKIISIARRKKAAKEPLPPVQAAAE